MVREQLPHLPLVCDSAYFQSRQFMLIKELVEVFRRVEHNHTCGVILFAFETWFYNQHDYRHIQLMLSACKLRLAYQPVLASAELWRRYFFAGYVLKINITAANDSNRHKELCSPAWKWICNSIVQLPNGAERVVYRLLFIFTALFM